MASASLIALAEENAIITAADFLGLSNALPDDIIGPAYLTPEGDRIADLDLAKKAGSEISDEEGQALTGPGGVDEFFADLGLKRDGAINISKLSRELPDGDTRIKQTPFGTFALVGGPTFERLTAAGNA